MNVLALDGALGLFSAAVACDERIAGCAQQSGNVALERGLYLVRQALDEAGWESASIDRLAVGTGPGSFTGLRIAIAYAKSLAAVWRLPLVPISSFDLVEFGGSFDRVLTVVVGRPGVISARYRLGSKRGGPPAEPPTCSRNCSPGGGSGRWMSWERRRTFCTRSPNAVWSCVLSTRP